MTSPHPHQHRIDLCNVALEAVRNCIPAELYEEVYDYINRVDEWGVGMESLIDQISELDIKITLEQFLSIEGAMASMDLAANQRMHYLRQHCVIT